MNVVFLGRPGVWSSRALDAGFELLAKGRNDRENQALADQGCTIIDELVEVWERFDPPRFYVIDAETGAAVDELVDTSYVTIEPGDCMIDTTISYWGDTLRRYRRMRHRAIFYIDVARLKTGTTETLLCSGETRAMDMAGDMLTKLAAPGPMLHAGEASAAHFCASVADGLLNARTHALSEARQLLEAFPQPTNIDELAAALDPIEGDATGRQTWLAEDSFNLEAPIPVLMQAAMTDIAEALDEHRSQEPLKKVGPFVHPDDIL